jgi:hypothetical protein
MNLPKNKMNKQNASSKIKGSKALISFLILLFMIISNNAALAQQKEMMVRISEIEIDPVYLDDYKAILKEEAAASVKLEPGVLGIFPCIKKKTRRR